MRIVIAPDSFKGCLSAKESSESMARGVERAALGLGLDVEIDLCPVSDGGAGFVDALITALGGELREVEVEGPLGEPVRAVWGFSDDDEGGTGVLEASQAFGFHLVPEDRRNPCRTSTYGVGQLISAALDAGCSKILVGIGNSSTCDGGVGMASALGVRFIDGDETTIDHPVGEDLVRIERIDVTRLDGRLRRARVVVACDVRNPLLGERGAAPVFAPQKGATPEQVRSLERGLVILVDRCREGGLAPHLGAPGAGAAGGMGFGLATFIGAELTPGAGVVLDALGFDDRVSGAELLLTGEGSLDEQSLEGKAAAETARRAAARGVPAVALAGVLGAGHEWTLEERGGPIRRARAIAPEGTSQEESIRLAREFLADAAEEEVRRIATGPP